MRARKVGSLVRCTPRPPLVLEAAAGTCEARPLIVAAQTRSRLLMPDGSSDNWSTNPGLALAAALAHPVRRRPGCSSFSAVSICTWCP